MANDSFDHPQNPSPHGKEKPTDLASDSILGIQKHHLPVRFQQFFLPDDIIIFKHRTFLETIKSREDHNMPSGIPPRNENIPERLFDSPRQCFMCAFDVLCAWVGIIAFSAVSIPVGLSILISPSIIRAIVFFIACTMQLLGLGFILSRSPIPITHRDNPKELHPHTLFNVARYLPRRHLERFDSFTWSACSFIHVWYKLHYPGRINSHTYDDKSRLFAPLSFLGRVKPTFLEIGWLYLRVVRYPDLFKRVRIPWVSAWLNEVYQTYRHYQRLQAAAGAIAEMQHFGLLEAHSPAPPIEYSISSLEQETDGFLFLNKRTVNYEMSRRQLSPEDYLSPNLEGWRLAIYHCSILALSLMAQIVSRGSFKFLAWPTTAKPTWESWYRSRMDIEE